MNDQPNQCQLCSTTSGTFDLRKLCCAARFIDSLPTYDQMISTGRKLVRQYGHDRKALSDSVKAIGRARAERMMAEQANR